MRSRTRGSLAAALVLTATLATGCADDGGSGDFADQSAEEISDAAMDAMADLDAVTVEGTLSTDGQEIGITMSIGMGGNCTGSYSTRGATAEILGVEGTTWFRSDAAFWELFAGPERAPQIIAAAGDRWVTLPEDDTWFKPFCDIEGVVGELEDAEYTKGEVGEIEGEETIEIISDRPDAGTSSGYVLVDGDHYLVKISKTEGPDPGELAFSGFYEEPDVEAPADDEQIPLEDLESGAY